MMMPKEGMVCFIVFFDNINIWFGGKSSLYLNYWESYDNFIDFTAVILNVSFQKNPLRMTALHRPRNYYGMLSCTIKRETNFYQQKQGYPHDYRTTLLLQTKIRKKTHFAPEYTRGPRHMAFLRRPLNRPHHYLAPLLHPLVPFYRPIMHFLKLIPLNLPELCITVTY